MKDKSYENVKKYEEFVRTYKGEILDQDMAKAFAQEYDIHPNSAYRLQKIALLSRNLRKLIVERKVGTFHLELAWRFDEIQQERLYILLRYAIDKHNVKKTVTKTICKQIMDDIKAGLTDYKIKAHIDLLYDEYEVAQPKRLPVKSYFHAKNHFTEDMTSKEKGDVFEQWCLDRLEQVGYSCRKTHENQDGGADIVAMISCWKVLVECKCRFNARSSVSDKVVDRIYEANKIYKCDHMIVITNAQYTEKAYERAKELGVVLWRHCEIH